MSCYPEVPAVTVSAVLSFPFQVTGQQHPVNVSSLYACVFFFFSSYWGKMNGHSVCLRL